jgi:hypothetical protein
VLDHPPDELHRRQHVVLPELAPFLGVEVAHRLPLPTLLGRHGQHHLPVDDAFKQHVAGGLQPAVHGGLETAQAESAFAGEADLASLLAMGAKVLGLPRDFERFPVFGKDTLSEVKFTEGSVCEHGDQRKRPPHGGKQR